MKVLFLMDPLVDYDSKFDDRSFVAKTDLNAIPLAKNISTQKGFKVSYAAISTILDKRDIRTELNSNYVEVVEFKEDEISSILNFYNTNSWSSLLGKAPAEFYKKIEKYFRDKLKNINPDVIIYWENISEVIHRIFPDAIFLEGSHTGFWTIEGNADILFKVFKNSQEISKFNVEALSKVQLQDFEKEEISDFRSFFKDHVVYDTQITRETIDPSGQFKHFICYPGNFPSSKFKKYSGVSNNLNIIKYLLNETPKDCAILYTPHNLDKELLSSPICMNDRLIDLSRFKEVDKDFTIKAIAISDAVVNVYSNIFMPAMTLGVPVFSIGNSPNAQFALGKVDELKKWLLSDQLVPTSYKELEMKVLYYVLTRKVNSSTLRLIRNSYNYLSLILDNIKTKKGFDCLPVLSTVRGYKEQFRINRLLKNKFNDSYLPTNYDVLLGNILNPKVKNIGFDVFDTLLCRPFVKPSDLFDLMEHDAENIIKSKSINFSRSRIAAENIARHGKIETNFDEIYDVLKQQLALNDEQTSKLKNLELACEFKYLKARESVMNFFRVAKENGKNIFIASDMYLSKEFISKCLVNNGYNLDNIPVFISCEHNAAKYDGSLFDLIEKRLNIKTTETLFVGDNLKSDIDKTLERGYISFHYPKSIDRLRENRLFTPQVMKFQADVGFSFHLGFIANKLFDNPFIKFDKNSTVNNSPGVLGYMIYGPLVLSVVDWLSKSVCNKNYDIALFSSRDSRVIIDIYDYIRKNNIYEKIPESKYIHISRTATLPAYCNQTHILTLLSLYNSRLSTGDFLKQVFDISVDDKTVSSQLLKFKINPELENRANLARIPAFLNEYFENNDELHYKLQCIKGYFEPLIRNKKVACFDLGSKGTSRDILADMFNQEIDLYLFRTIRYKSENNIKSYTQDDLNPYRHGIRSLLPQFYELLLSDPLHKTCQGYKEIDKGFVPIVEKSEFTKSSLLVIEAQRYIRDFCYEYIDLFTCQTKYINSQSRNVFIYPLSYLCANTTDQFLLSQFEGDDPFWSKGTMSIISNPLSSGVKIKNDNEQKVNVKEQKDNSLGSKYYRLNYKLQNKPSEYLRDSSLPSLQRVYKLTKIPVIGKPIERLACNIIKSVITSKKANS